MDNCVEIECDVSEDETIGDSLNNQFKYMPWYISSSAIHLFIFIIALLLWPDRKLLEAPSIVAQTTIDEPEEEKFEKPPDPVVKNIEVPIEQDIKVETEVFVECDVEIEVEEEITDEPVEGDPSDFTDFDTDINSPALMGLGSTGGAGGRGGKFGSRTGTGKNGALRKGGGGRHTETLLDHALKWLATHQEFDGHWDCAKYEGGNADDAVTGLAMLAFLGAGHSSKHGKYKKNVAAAKTWIMGRQDATGHYGVYRYQASMTLMAMCEEYGMSEDYNMEASVQRAVDAACNAQNGDGGWRYTPGKGYSSGGNGGGKSDTSVSGWWMMALKSAKTAGLNVPNSTWEGAKKYFSADGIAQGDGYDWRGRYQPNGGTTAIPTAALMCCRQFLGYPQADEIIVGCANNLIQGNNVGKAFLPSAKLGQGDGSQNFYLWYYEALGFFQLGAKSEYWKKFNPIMIKELDTTQRKDGTYEQFKGSWNPENGHNFHGGNQWGRVGQTAVGALMLEVYYRYANVHKK